MEILYIANNLGYSISNSPTNVLYSGCAATLKNGYVILPNLDVVKCHESIEILESEAGKLLKGFESVSNDYNLSINELPSKCKPCRILPICGGGCPKRLKEKGRPMCIFRTIDGINFDNVYDRSFFTTFLIHSSLSRIKR